VKEEWEKFAQMDMTLWLSVMTIAICAVLARLICEGTPLTMRIFIEDSIIAGFVAYISTLYLLASDTSLKMASSIVGGLTYQSKNILTGIAKIGAAFAKDPFQFLNKTKRGDK